MTQQQTTTIKSMIILKTTKNNEQPIYKTIDMATHERITGKETLKWFRRFGGSETAQRAYTCQGYNVIKLISRSPGRSNKTVREFKFVSIPTYKHEQLFEKLFKCIDSSTGKFYLKRFKRALTFKEVLKVLDKKAPIKSTACTMVLRAMDNDLSYTDALNKVLKEHTHINKMSLEKELNKYI